MVIIFPKALYAIQHRMQNLLETPYFHAAPDLVVQRVCVRTCVFVLVMLSPSLCSRINCAKHLRAKLRSDMSLNPSLRSRAISQVIMC